VGFSSLAIYSITNWPIFIFNQLAINFVVPCAFGQTHSLTSFGRALGFSSDLAMCVAVKRWHWCLFYFKLLINGLKAFSNFGKYSTKN